LPRYRHKPADCPYAEYGLTLSYYYIDKPVISGNFSAICDASHRTFSESTFTDIDLNYDWNCTGPLSEVDGDGTPKYTVERTFLDGTGTVSLTVTTPSGTTAATSKNIWVGQPDASDFTVYVEERYGDPVSGSPGGPFEVCDNSSYWICLYPFFLFDDQGINDVEFDFNFDYDVLDEGDDYIVIHIDKIYEEDTGEIYVNSECGYITLKFLDFVEGNCGYYLMFTPNPTTGETTLSIETTSEDTEFDENAEWELEVYSPAQLLKEKKTNLRGKNAKIQTSGWTEGIYMVRVKYKDEVLQGKLVVKR